MMFNLNTHALISGDWRGRLGAHPNHVQCSPIRPPSTVNATPEAEERAIVTINSSAQEGVIDGRFGSKADIVGYQRDVRFTPKSGHH
jgi:hypothetical protein